MNYDNEIDKLEEVFKREGFQESLTTEDLKKLKSTFTFLVKDMYQLKKLEGASDITTAQSESIEELTIQVKEKLQFCRAMCGLE
ncbi:MAG: hypothetical protein ACTSQZ_01400 [Candidatus Thorarchaeota archaeon]